MKPLTSPPIVEALIDLHFTTEISPHDARRWLQGIAGSTGVITDLQEHRVELGVTKPSTDTVKVGASLQDVDQPNAMIQLSPRLVESLIYKDIRNGLDVNGNVKPRQVRPRRGTVELSVIVIDNLKMPEIQVLGASIRKKDPQSVVGWAQIDPTILVTQGALSVLSFRIDYRPIARHGNILGWPTDEETQLALAHELAMAAVGVECSAQRVDSQSSRRTSWPSIEYAPAA